MLEAAVPAPDTLPSDLQVKDDDLILIDQEQEQKDFEQLAEPAPDKELVQGKSGEGDISFYRSFGHRLNPYLG